jgi:chemotaxis protein histidine kinase CheA
MSDFAGMEELLQDFLTEANELLSDVDNKLVELEKHPNDAKLLNDIFRGFHTIKGGAGFLNVEELVKLCHLTENLFDRLRNHEIPLNAELMDVILSATMGVRDMFGYLERRALPHPADPALLAALKEGVEGNLGKAPPEAEARTAADGCPRRVRRGDPDCATWRRTRLAEALRRTARSRPRRSRGPQSARHRRLCTRSRPAGLVGVHRISPKANLRAPVAGTTTRSWSPRRPRSASTPTDSTRCSTCRARSASRRTA